MAFVYRYKTDSGEIIYIGKTNKLNERVNAHRQDPWWNDALVVEYIDNLTPADADMLETYYISKCNPKYNVRKQWGASKIDIDTNEYNWIPISRAPIVRRHIEDYALTVRPICARCGKTIDFGDETSVQFSALGPPCHIEIRGYVCKQCISETLYADLEQLSNLTEDFFIYRSSLFADLIKIPTDCED